MRCKVPCRRWMPAKLLQRCIFVFGALVLLALLSVYVQTSADFIPESSQLISDHLHLRDVRDVENSHVIGKTNDVHDLINKIQTARPDFFPDWYWAISMDKLAKYLHEKSRKTDDDVLRSQKSDEMDNTGHWATLDRHIRQFSLYNPDDIALKAVLKDMATLPIEETELNTGGSQLKLNVRFKDGGWAVLKPMRLSRYNASRKSIYDTSERHFAEIAAFHLDRILGTYRVPPTIGRHVNIPSELIPLLPQSVNKTVYISEDGRTCFYGHCRQLCKKKNSFCGSPHSIEVSLMYFLPNTTRRHHTMLTYRNPWRPGGNKTSRAQLCNRTKLEIAAGNDYLLDLHDAFYFDTLIDNFDRHSYAMYDGYNNLTVPVLFDNGRSFGPPSKDAMLDYAKWHGCCLMKMTTFLKYLRLFMGPETLSELMRNSLHADPVDPVLPEDELMALDRRVNKTIAFIQTCLAKQSLNDVIIDDIMP